ncbi:Protein rhomboid [Lamellibrachia satsuma]|nr:Protein rhomboid [Lamellibrachia satsuma]
MGNKTRPSGNSITCDWLVQQRTVVQDGQQTSSSPRMSPFMYCVSILQTGVFLYLRLTTGDKKDILQLVPGDNVLTFHADHCHQLWRFLSYALLHTGWLHLLSNLLIQLVAGISLEVVHGSTRVGLIYVAGIFAGSLSTCAFDKSGVLVGASGGGYAVMVAHFADLLLNYPMVQFKLPKMAAIFIIVAADIATAAWHRHTTVKDQGSVSYVTHVAGATAGLTSGLMLLRTITGHKAYTRAVRLVVLLGCVTIILALTIHVTIASVKDSGWTSEDK